MVLESNNYRLVGRGMSRVGIGSCTLGRSPPSDAKPYKGKMRVGASTAGVFPVNSEREKQTMGRNRKGCATAPEFLQVPGQATTFHLHTFTLER
jgi:hypothetical protein